MTQTSKTAAITKTAANARDDAEVRASLRSQSSGSRSPQVFEPEFGAQRHALRRYHAPASPGRSGWLASVRWDDSVGRRAAARQRYSFIAAPPSMRSRRAERAHVPFWCDPAASGAPQSVSETAGPDRTGSLGSRSPASPFLAACGGGISIALATGCPGDRRPRASFRLEAACAGRRRPQDRLVGVRTRWLPDFCGPVSRTPYGYPTAAVRDQRRSSEITQTRFP